MRYGAVKMIAVIAGLCGLSACGPQTPAYTVTGDGITAPLTPESVSARRGQILFETRSDAHCVLCHVHARSDAPFQGNLGPDLSRVSDRLSPAQIRLRLVDYDAVIPGTTMPSYYRTKGLRQVATVHAGQTVLTAQEIEDIIAFLIEDRNDDPRNDDPNE